MNKYRWIVEIEVDAELVADGFDLTDDRAQRMLAHHLPYALGHQFRAKVLEAPDPKLLRMEQGYNDDNGEKQGACIYCDRVCNGPKDEIPAFKDETRWVELALDHHPNCPWVTTRAWGGNLKKGGGF